MLAILNKKQLGDIAEEKACLFLKAKGFSFVDRNYRSPFGEIDLIMKDNEEIVFIEVRSRRDTLYGTAIESINRIKQQKVMKSALCYLQKRKWLDKVNYRFDVVGCSPTHIEWIKNAFSHG
jgi:putative endonuclease